MAQVSNLRFKRRNLQSCATKKFLILTASFGEGHNAAARGIRDGLLQHAPEARVDVRDLFAESLGPINAVARRAYLEVINRAPRIWSRVYSSIDRATEFRRVLRWLAPARYRLAQLIARDQPAVIISVYPAYPHLLDEILGPAAGSTPRRIVCVTDSISINAIWFRCSTDFFLLANEQSATVLRRAGVGATSLRVPGFPVDPRFAALSEARASGPPWRILYMINARSSAAGALAQKLAAVPDTELTVTVGRNEALRREFESLRAGSARRFRIIGWTSELPQLMGSHHLLIGKAGGATVQEGIAARCPMIVNQIVPGQEEGNAQLITETKAGCVALSPDEVINAIIGAIRDNGKLLNEWTCNIAKLSRPGAALEIADFLLAL